VKLAVLKPDQAPSRDDSPRTLARRIGGGSALPLKPPEPAESQRSGVQRFKVYTESKLEKIPHLHTLAPEQRFAMRVVAKILPFRVNQYVIDELIDWTNVPDDPIFQLSFPQRGMLSDDHFGRMASLLSRDADRAEIKALAHSIRAELNPHPAGQQKHNVPKLDGVPLSGVQHKYDETVLFFPAQGQTCHSYCTFCFRWAQFIGDKTLKFASTEEGQLVEYLKRNQQVSDVLITGGDPMVMNSKRIAQYAEALLDPALEHVQNIRFGSKALTFWPQRFVTDSDADDLLRVLERLVAAGKHVAFMAHFNHWREFEPAICRRAIQRIRSTGAVIRSQGPLLRHINDSSDVWTRMWREQVKMGIVPYYMFVERDTGARRYFEVPLQQAYRVYRDAITSVSGLARTARGPSLSAGPGKVEIQGITEVAGEKVFVLRFIQARNSAWCQQPFFAAYDEKATWLDHLRPAFGESRFFFEDEYRDKFGATTLK
jgi:KamA family protein